MTKTAKGLRGESVGETLIATVGKEGHGLTYRGYRIEDLAPTQLLKRLPTFY